MENKDSNENDYRMQELKKDKLLFSQDVLEKKFGLYQWISAQNSILMGLNTLLIGAAYLLYQNYKEKETFWDLLLPSLSILLISVSTIVCLINAIPTMKSALWDKTESGLLPDSIRTVLGASKYNLGSYLSKLHALDYDEMLKLNADEILKVNNNVYEYYRKIRTSVILSIMGLLLLLSSWVLTIPLIKPISLTIAGILRTIFSWE